MIHLNTIHPKANLHFSGIGGIGMSGLAEIMYKLGYNVQGTDICTNYVTKKLESDGIKIFNSHEKSDLKKVSFLIKSSAIQDDNYELQYCAKKGIPIITRAELLAALMRSKVAISISGMHGKTTTTGFIASLLEKAGLDPTVIVGGIINNKKTNAYLGLGNFMVVEADESDGTFIKITSTIAVVTNMDREHMDFYKNYDNVKKAFRKFIEGIPFYGFAVLCIDDKDVRELNNKIKTREIITYSLKQKDADVFATNIKKTKLGHSFDICFGERLGNTVIKKVKLNIPGVHNVQNALAAAAIVARLHLNLDCLKDGIAEFDNIKRRFTLTNEVNGIKFIDDYAHHPREIQATLSTAKQVVSDTKGRVFVVFQPHRYSRLHSLFDEFVRCFKGADILYVSDIYAANEKPIDGVTKECFVQEVKKLDNNKEVQTLRSHEDLPEIIKDSCRANDIVLFLGAGDITDWAYNVPLLLHKL